MELNYCAPPNRLMMAFGRIKQRVLTPDFLRDVRNNKKEEYIVNRMRRFHGDFFIVLTEELKEI